MPISVKSEEYRSEGLKGNAQKNISSIVRNMISAFESSPAQVQRPDVNLSAKSQLRKLERKGFSVQNAKNPRTYSQSTQCPTFSEPLFEDKPEGRHQYVLSTRGEMKGKHNRWFTNSGNNETISRKEDKGIRIIDDKNLLETSVFDTTSCIPQRTNDNLQLFNLEEKITVGDCIESLKQGQEPLLSQVQTGCYITSPSIIHSESDGKNFSDASGKRPSCPSITDSVSSDEQIIHKVADSDISSGNIESTLTENRTLEWFKARTQMLDQLLDSNLQKSVHGVVSETRKWRDFRTDVDKLTTCIPLHKNGNIPSLPSVEHYLLENLGGWIPVHLCYTTASRKLRSLIEGNTIQAGTCSLEQHFSQRAAAEPQMLDDGCILMKNETSGSSRNTTIQSLFQVPKISGELIQQGVRFVAIVVCGAILFKTRQ
ncbi:hypothetical protein QJS04_geneDACA014996 [Acorus gramineus]|uniref:Uncharacterized protein n=1 Tax=Acorus gramineus TaxID=55184 RepID=A0AAV9AMM1_ACOGR|nr:hypothetical protein QJS04_geneDACA014996 [Acorus gramineus]